MIPLSLQLTWKLNFFQARIRAALLVTQQLGPIICALVNMPPYYN
ncbi:hypothetical protein DSUL_150031 [Desulfovibrionales bacterium]